MEFASAGCRYLGTSPRYDAMQSSDWLIQKQPPYSVQSDPVFPYPAGVFVLFKKKYRPWLILMAQVQRVWRMEDGEGNNLWKRWKLMVHLFSKINYFQTP